MANIKFSAFTQKVVLGDVDFLVGYTGADNVRVAPSVFSGVYLPLAGGTMTGDTLHGDDVKSLYGASDDLSIYHSGSDSYIRDLGAGSLRITTNKFTVLNAANAETMINAEEGGAVDLYHSNVKKFETTAEGVNLPDNNALFLDNTNNNNPVYFRNAGTNAATLQIGRGTTPGSNVSMEISTGGDVGIGVVPTTKLDIGGMADPIVRIKSDVGGDPQLRFDGSAANRAGLIKFYDNGAAAGGFIDYHHLGDKMNFGAGSVSTITMTVRDGAVGIGANINPDFNANATNLVVGSGAGSQGMTIFTGQNAGDYGSIYFADGQADGAEEYRGMITYEQNAEKMRFHTNTVEALELDVNQNAAFAGNVSLPDNGQLNLGAGNDLQLYHDGANSYITNAVGHIYMINSSDDKNIYFQTDDGAGGTTTYVKIDGLSEYTQFDKPGRFMDNVNLQFGNSNDAYIGHNGTSWSFTNGVNDADINFNCDDGAGGTATYMFLDGSIVLTRFLKGANFDDNVKLTFGDVVTPGDLEIYHDGSNSYIRETGTGNMYIQASERIRFTGINNEALLYLNENSNVEMYYDNALKLETIATGTKTTGQMDIAALNVAPASAGAAGTLGEIRYTADYIYVCTATNTWKRTAISTW